MKKILAAMLVALMLVTILPLASLPYASAGITIEIYSSLWPATPEEAYVGELISWLNHHTNENIGSYQYSFDVWKDGQLFAGEGWHETAWRYYTFTSPGKYKVKAWVWDMDNNKIYYEFSREITVNPSINRITKVEPLSATSLRITWNKVPGAGAYFLHRSTDLKNWELVQWKTGTSFTDTYLRAGTRYFYSVVYSRTGVFMCEPSPAVTGVPMAKTRITSITSPSARRIRMTWAYAEGASGYQVAMATSANGNYKTVRIVTGGTTAIFSGVKSGTSLYFKVRPYRRVYTTTYWGQYSAYRAVKVK